jgi:hypothetical protein
MMRTIRPRAVPDGVFTQASGVCSKETVSIIPRPGYLNTMMRMPRGYDIAPALAPELASGLSAALQGFVSAESAGRGRTEKQRSSLAISSNLGSPTVFFGWLRALQSHCSQATPEK